jgi:hypothetical protein
MQRHPTPACQAAHSCKAAVCKAAHEKLVACCVLLTKKLSKLQAFLRMASASKVVSEASIMPAVHDAFYEHHHRVLHLAQHATVMCCPAAAATGVISSAAWTALVTCTHSANPSSRQCASLPTTTSAMAAPPSKAAAPPQPQARGTGSGAVVSAATSGSAVATPTAAALALATVSTALVCFLLT